MIYCYENTCNYLRKKYFSGDYMSFGLSQDKPGFELTLNNRIYFIKYFYWLQETEFIKKIDKKLHKKYPEIFL